MGRITVLATGERLGGKGVRAFNPAGEELIRAARREIQVAVYRIDASALPLLDLLEDAVRRGVQVVIVVSAVGRQPGNIRERLMRLREIQGFHLVDFRSEGGGFLHAKTIVVDREKAVIGSANLTWGGLIGNHEIGVLIEGPEAWEIARLLDSLAGQQNRKPRPVP